MARTKQTARRATTLEEKRKQELEEQAEAQQIAETIANEIIEKLNDDNNDDEYQSPRILKESSDDEEEEQQQNEDDDELVYRIEVEIVGTKRALFAFSSLKRSYDATAASMTFVREKKPCNK